MLKGFTYSHRRAQHLGIDPVAGLNKLLTLKPNLIRLGLYWDEVEKVRGVFDFTKINQMLQVCEKHHQSVIVTVGMKAPHWPEYYLPVWLKKADWEQTEESVLKFINQSLRALSKFDCIKYWQVENEPLDPSGKERQQIPLQLLTKEIEAVRKQSRGKKIVVTLWGNDLKRRNYFSMIEPLVDIIGLDLYYKQFQTKNFLFSLYKGPSDKSNAIDKLVKKSAKGLWITELQAEPWEANHNDYASDNPNSMSPEQLEKNFANASILNPEAILLWGSEYWLWKEKSGDLRLWKTVQTIFNNSSKRNFQGRNAD